MQDEQAKWNYTSDELEGPPGEYQGFDFDEVITWSASEYIAHEKSQIWYLKLMCATLLVTLVVYLITRDLIAVAAIITLGFSAAFFGSRPPQAKQYELSLDGLKVDGKNYDFGNFKSFSVVEEGAVDSIWFKPLTRFAPMLIIYFSPEDEDKIVQMLSGMLPHEQRVLDAIERASRRMRF